MTATTPAPAVKGPTGSAPRRASRLGGRLAALQRRYPLAQVVALAALFVYGSVSLSGFSQLLSIKTMLILASLLGIAATGQTIVILLGGLDLSVPGTIAVGNVMIAQLVGGDHWPFAGALALIVVIGIVGGAATGYICSRFQANPLIVTLGTGSVAVGAVLVWTKGQVVTAGVPGWLSRLTSPVAHTFGVGIPPVVLVWAVIAVAVGVFLHRTIAGRRTYAAGSNPLAARLALVPIVRLWMIAFAISAVSGVLAGILLAGYSGSGDSTVGQPYLFTGLAAVIVGGTTLIGARGDYWRTVLGALVLTELSTILVGRGFSTADQQILYGIVILLVVPAYGRDRRASDRV